MHCFWFNSILIQMKCQPCCFKALEPLIVGRVLFEKPLGKSSDEVDDRSYLVC